MSDIFISYSREDREQVQQLANSLQKNGWSVWWDRDILAGDSFHKVIDKELSNSRCVVVVWSKSSIISDWVRDEADEAKSRNILLPVLLDKTKPPLGFRSYQAQDLSNWDGEVSSSVINSLYDSVKNILGGRPVEVSDLQRIDSEETNIEVDHVIDSGRVELFYQEEISGRVMSRELPFVIGVLGDFSVLSENKNAVLEDRQFIKITAAKCDSVISRIQPRLKYRVANRLLNDKYLSELDVEVFFNGMSDFEPQAVAQNTKPLCWLIIVKKALYRLSDYLSEVEKDKILSVFQQKKSFAEFLSALFNILNENAHSETILDVSELRAAPGEEVIVCQRLVSEVAELLDDPFGAIELLDTRISMQLDEIIHASPFQRLESSWRGLNFLLKSCEHFSEIQVQLLDISKAELATSLEDGDLETNYIFKLLYHQQFGVADGAPFGLVLCDWEYGKHEEDIEQLKNIARYAREMNSIFIASASKEHLNIARKNSPIGDLEWNKFRQSMDSNYVALTLPRVLYRLPYIDPRSQVGSFMNEIVSYGEKIEERRNYLWGSSGYVLSSVIAKTFNRFGWFANMTDSVTYGRTTHLPVFIESGEIIGPTEFVISGQQESEMSDAGVVPLVNEQQTDSVVYYSANTIHEPELLSDDLDTNNERENIKISSMLIINRFVLLMKIMMRDKIGSFMSVEDVETWLSRWLEQYVVDPEGNANTPDSKRPLLASQFKLQKLDGIEGKVLVDVYLLVGYQVKEPVELRVKFWAITL